MGSHHKFKWNIVSYAEVDILMYHIKWNEKISMNIAVVVVVVTNGQSL